ncbi:unnamed protein product [Durusdinium trenchii]|uniref:Serine/threonine specific protein phosphatases domain-containing protein n=1 Tax=Durusdinium trenchii TaxID=1381693 RepID=A0ABP0LS42_9DINO
MVANKRLRLQEPAEECPYEVGSRVVFTPPRGPARLCTVSSVTSDLGRCHIGLQSEEGSWCVPSCSSGLKKVLLPQDKAVLRRLLQGLEAKSESDALRFSSKQRKAFEALRGTERPGSKQAVPRPVPTPWSTLLSHITAGTMTWEDAHSVFQSCSNGENPLPCSLLLALVRAGKELVRWEPMLLRLSVPAGRLVILGDTHGHLKDVVHIWKTEGLPSKDLVYLFNGDICDRGDSERRGGQRALQIWASVLAYKIAAPECIYVTRGNHEDRDYWPQYGATGFSGEIEAKYDRSEADDLLDAFGELCDQLPLAAVVQEQCLVLHGGLPRCWADDPSRSLQDLEALERPLCIPENVDGRQKQLIYDATWADPQKENGLGPNDRGGEAISFGPDVTCSVLKSFGLQLLLRSHELPGRGSEEFKGRGFEWWHACEDEMEVLLKGAKGLCLSLFTASDYCGCLEGNSGARVIFDGDGFHIVEHQGWEAEHAFLQSQTEKPFDPAEGMLFEGPLERSVIEAVVERKHELLAEFMASDAPKDWLLPLESWQACCHRVLPQIPWQDHGFHVFARHAPPSGD